MNWKNVGKLFAVVSIVISGTSLAIPDQNVSKFMVALGTALNAVSVYIANTEWEKEEKGE